MGSIFGGGSESEPGFPRELRNIADLIAGNFPGAPGLLADMYAGGMAVPANDFFGVLANQWGPLAQAGFQGGDITRQLASGLTSQGLYGAGQLANQAMGAAQGGQSLLANQGGFMDAANAFAGGINTANTGFGQAAGRFNPAFQQLQGAFGGANQFLQEMLAPTAMNEQFQYALQNQVLPQVRSAYAARGLGTSGIGAGAESEATANLANQFDARRFAQGQQALATIGDLSGVQGSLASGLGNLASLQGNLGVAASQVPGSILNQFMQANNLGVQGALGAQQAQMGPLQLAGLGAGLYNQGLDMGLRSFGNLYNTARAPQTLGVNLLGGSAGTFSNPIFTAFGIPY